MVKYLKQLFTKTPKPFLLRPKTTVGTMIQVYGNGYVATDPAMPEQTRVIVDGFVWLTVPLDTELWVVGDVKIVEVNIENREV